MIEPTEEQAEALKLAQAVERLSETQGFVLATAEMERFVKEAHEEMVAAKNPSPLKAQSLLMRYQQRRAAVNRLLNFVEAHAENKKQILEELQGEQENGNDTESTD